MTCTMFAHYKRAEQLLEAKMENEISAFFKEILIASSEFLIQLEVKEEKYTPERNAKDTPSESMNESISCECQNEAINLRWVNEEWGLCLTREQQRRSSPKNATDGQDLREVWLVGC